MSKPALNNFSAFKECLASQFYQQTHPEQYAVVFLNIDYLKGINIFFEASHADQLSKEIANRIKQAMGEFCYAEYLGYDEFAFFIPANGLTEDTISHKIINLIKELAEPFDVSGKTIYIYTHAGIEIIKAKYPSIDNSITNARLALQFAKVKGHNQFVIFTPAVSLYIKKPYSLLKELHKAVQNKEFVLNYQPQINPKTNKIMGYEALMRWEHPSKGTIMPTHFISALEDNKMMLEMGEWVLEQACITLSEMQKASDERLSISVNVSAIQLKSPKFSEFIRSLIKRHSIDTRCLIMEITETSLLYIEPVISMTLNYLSEAGIRIMLDDFGTGYASFLHLKHFPISGIKIDGNFIKDLPKAKDAKMFEAIVEFSKTLGLKITVEGVETQAQHKMMQHYDTIESAQGFLYSRAVDKDIAIGWVGKSPAKSWDTYSSSTPIKIRETEKIDRLLTDPVII